MADKIYSQGGSDPRTGPERLAALVNRAFASKDDKQVRAYGETQQKARDTTSFGEPAPMTDVQKTKIRALRKQGSK